MSSANTPTIGPLDPREVSPLPLERGDVVAERYEVLRLLGSGGTAYVYAVRDRRIGDELALKLLRDDVDVARSRREAEFARGSSTPRLVRAFDLVEADGLVFLTMELVPGGSLKERLRRGPLPIDDAIRLAAEILEALRDLHALGIVHRDLKPGNLLLTADGHIKLSDFGIARRWTDDDSRLTVTGATLGTIDYLSPEQALGEDVDPRSDLFSFGVVLYELLTGRLPFDAPSKVAAIGMRLHRQPDDVRTLRRDTPRWLAAIVARLMRTNREERYASAEAVLRDLRRRRVGIAMPRMRLVMLLGLLVVVSVAWWRMRPVPAALAGDEWELHVLDRNGNVLWSRNDTQASTAAIVHRPGTTEVAAIVAPSWFESRQPRYYRRLSFLQQNRIVRTVTLPSAAASFPEYSNHYSADVMGADLDQDGTDEVFVAYSHHYYPWFLVRHDALSGESRIMYISSGLQHILGFADVDGDGTREVIVTGIANRMGWYHDVAAIRFNTGGAYSPDREDMPVNDGLVWFALCPPGNLVQQIELDESARVIRFPYETGTIELPFPRAETERVRRLAFQQLRDASRLINGGYATEAVPKAERARQLGVMAGDETLAEWCDRVKGKALVHARRFDEANAFFTALCKRSSNVSDISHDAGAAFHVMGQLERAVAWYRRAVGPESQRWVGRVKYESLYGLVLALGELGRWDDARADLDAFNRLYDDDLSFYRDYVTLRTGGAALSTYNRLDRPDPDRWVGLEAELSRSTNPAALLPTIDSELGLASETRRLVLLTKAEALRRAGRRVEAFAVARNAYDQLQQHRRTSALDHAHVALAEERLRRIAAELGVAWHPTRMAP